MPRSAPPLATPLLLLLALLPAGCAPARPAGADWSRMSTLVGDWGCDARFQTPDGPLVLPMVTTVSRTMDDRWLHIHREAPGYNRTTGRFVEDDFTGWDRRRAQWVTTFSNNFGVQGYLTATGWQTASISWDQHPFTDLSLPLRNRVVWRTPSAAEWTVEFRATANPGAITLLSERCLRRTTPSL